MLQKMQDALYDRDKAINHLEAFKAQNKPVSIRIDPYYIRIRSVLTRIDPIGGIKSSEFGP